MKKVLFAILASLAVVFAIVTASERATLVRVSDRKPVSFEAMIRDAVRSDVIVIGETHGNPLHHALQLEVIRALHESDTPLVIGMEMFRQGSQKDLDDWTSGAVPPERFVPVYYRNWTIPWRYYEDIFLYAREHTIPIVGLNIPDEISTAIARRGFAALTRAERRKLPAGISCTIDKSYMEFIKKVYADHGRGDGKSFQRFCEAQMVWDKSMAANLIAFMKENPEKKAVVLAGVGHAWRRGIPEQLSLLSTYRTQVILPVVPDQPDLNRVSVGDADYIVLP
ncbi:MAG: ChaN family lipoprotein [Nitrospirota bacterium]